MSFFNKIQSALGLGGEAEYDDTLDIYAQTPSTQPGNGDEDNEANSKNEVLLSGIFDKVVEIFNQNLPDFLAKSVDPEKQKHLLYEALDESVKSHLQSLEFSVKARCEQMWSQERSRLQEEAEAQKRHAEDLEQKRQELNDQRLSADRQKRALSDRVRDLESQVLALEAEKEQYEIESKCMVNKTKAAAVFENELEELRKENEQLRKEKSALQQAGPVADQAENGVSMEELEAVMQQIEMFEEVKAKLNANIDSLKQSLKEAQAENESLRETIKTNLLDNAAQQQELRKQIEELKSKKDAAKLEDTASASDFVETKSKPDPTSNTVVDDVQIEDDADVDDVLNGTDWLISIPEKENAMQDVVEDSEFGYQEPVKKARATKNDSQLSLFDFD